MKRIFLLMLFALVFACSCSDPGWPPQTSDDLANRIFQSIRQHLEQKQTTFPQIDAEGTILCLYDGSGGRICAGGRTLEESSALLRKDFIKLNTNSSESTLVSTYTITLTIIRKTSKIIMDLPAKFGLFYEKGLHGIAYSDGTNSVRILDPPFIAARDWSFVQAKKKLLLAEGTPVQGLRLSKGVHRVVCESFTEPEPGAAPLPLFRANVLLDKVDPSIIRQAIMDGGHQLVRLQMNSGRFAYTYDLGTDKRETRKYNLLRHAGTCYSLYGLFGETGDPVFLEAANRGIDWLMGKMETPTWDPDRAYPVYHKKAKLGGAALSLLALCERVKVDPDYSVSPIMNKLATHLRKEQREDGSFNSYYSWNKKPVKKRFSIYYPGEAMLALIRYYNLVPESKASLEVAAKGADFLIDERWRIAGIEVNVPPDAWLMMALYEIWQAQPSPKFADYCLRIADVMASDQHVKLVPDADYFGGYFPDPPQVTPAGSRLEGLTAAYLLAKEAGRPTDWIYDTIVRGATFQVRMQVRRQFDHLFANPAMALGTFRHSPVDATNRIDYNQHNISGLIVAANIMESAR